MAADADGATTNTFRAGQLDRTWSLAQGAAFRGALPDNFLRTIAGARMLGTQAPTAGIRPQVAQTLAMRGSDLGPIATSDTLETALQHCLTQERRASK